MKYVNTDNLVSCVKEESDIYMPNEIFADLRLWLSQKELKTPHHQEFIYSYYWLITYLWRYASYANQRILQKDIKSALRYNPDDKSLNYLIKQNGLLDLKQYSLATRNYPVAWEYKNKEDGVVFTMYNDLGDDYKKMLSKFTSANYIVKAPLISLGTEVSDGIYWNPSDTHSVGKDIFGICMKNNQLGCAGFYMYGILKYLQDKSIHFNNSKSFECGNDTLVELTGWGIKRVARITSELMSVGLLNKEQQVKRKGQRNTYVLL